MEQHPVTLLEIKQDLHRIAEKQEVTALAVARLEVHLSLLSDIRSRVAHLERWKAWTIGASAAIGAAASIVIRLFLNV